MKITQIMGGAWVVMVAVGVVLEADPMAITLCVVLSNIWFAAYEICKELKS